MSNYKDLSWSDGYGSRVVIGQLYMSVVVASFDPSEPFMSTVSGLDAFKSHLLYEQVF
mgnify:CR=1 FL=1